MLVHRKKNPPISCTWTIPLHHHHSSYSPLLVLDSQPDEEFWGIWKLVLIMTTHHCQAGCPGWKVGSKKEKGLHGVIAKPRIFISYHFWNRAQFVMTYKWWAFTSDPDTSSRRERQSVGFLFIHHALKHFFLLFCGIKHPAWILHALFCATSSPACHLNMEIIILSYLARLRFYLWTVEIYNLNANRYYANAHF